ncbi:MAG TPA: hypothetical protein VEL47_00105, partial [Myxococcota bacterium]|nr:hypothetical protein [Myxococcota bacterium]
KAKLVTSFRLHDRVNPFLSPKVIERMGRCLSLWRIVRNQTCLPKMAFERGISLGSNFKVGWLFPKEVIFTAGRSIRIKIRKGVVGANSAV